MLVLSAHWSIGYTAAPVLQLSSDASEELDDHLALAARLAC
jgi:hypothetical protein